MAGQALGEEAAKTLKAHGSSPPPVQTRGGPQTNLIDLVAVAQVGEQRQQRGRGLGVAKGRHQRALDKLVVVVRNAQLRQAARRLGTSCHLFSKKVNEPRKCRG